VSFIQAMENDREGNQYLTREIPNKTDLETKLGLVRESRALFGDEGGRQIWKLLGLPSPGIDSASVCAASPLDEFINEMIVPACGCEISCRTLYLVYCEWHQNKSGARLHQVGFGRALHKAGLRSRRYNGTIYLDVRVKSPAPPSMTLANPQTVGVRPRSDE
jgi:hypothetical protein